MTPAFAIELPLDMPPDELDRRLAAGWFRSGPAFYRTDVVLLGAGAYGVAHIRLPLDRADTSRNRRRVLRRNRERFDVLIEPACLRSGHRELYHKTKHRFQGFVANDPAHLVYAMEPGVFDTWQCEVYDGRRLVAVSYFDIGHQAVASQLCLYDPEYAKYSLGLYTMLEEVAYARERGCGYYYPGYVVAGLPVFDYKLRVGDVQFMDGGGRWRRRATPPSRVTGFDAHMRRVRRLERALKGEDVPFERRVYPGFWFGGLDDTGDRYLTEAIHLAVDDDLVIEPIRGQDEYRIFRPTQDPEVDLLDGFDAIVLPEHVELRALLRGPALGRLVSEREVARFVRALRA